MAIRKFNSVGGFSVGENPTDIILANGDITTTNANLTGNLNVTHVNAGNVYTDNLRYANGVVWDLQEAAGTDGQIQFNSNDNFAASGNLTFVEGTSGVGATPAALTVTGNVNTTNLYASGDATFDGTVTATNFSGTFAGTVELSGYETGIVYIDEGSATADANLTWDNAHANLSLIGNITVDKKVTANIVVAENYFTGVLGASSSSQPNIHTLGELSNLDVSGSANVHDFFANGNVKFTDAQFANKSVPFFDQYNRVVADVSKLSYDSSTQLLHTQKIEANSHFFLDGDTSEIPYLDGNKKAITDPDFTYDDADGTLYITRGVATGLITAGDFYTAGNANIDTNINLLGEISVGGNANISTHLNVTGHAEITGYANIQANANIATNLGVGGTIDAIDSITTSNNLFVTGYANVTGNVKAANLNTADSGYANVHYLKVRGTVDSDLIPTGLNYNLGNATHPWKDAWISGGSLHIGTVTVTDTSGNLTTANGYYSDTLTAEHFLVNQEANIVGDLIVGGDLTVGGVTTYVNVDSLSISDPLIILGGGEGGGNLVQADGKDRGLYLKNYDASGAGSVFNQFIGWKTSASEFQLLESITESGDVVSGNLANVRVQTVFANLFHGVFDASSSSQPNIHTIGNLTNANIDGNLNVTSTATVGTLIASDLTYPTADGTNRQVLSTDGAGELYWATIDTYKAANGTSNVTVNGPGPDNPSGTGGNVTISVGGTSNVVVVSTSGVDVTGNLSISGSLDVGAVSMSGVALGDSAIKSETYTTISTTQNQTIASVPLAGTSIRGVFFDVKGECVSEQKYTIASISAIHDDNSVDFATHGLIHMGGSAGSFIVVYGSNSIDLQVTPAHGADTVWTTQYRTV